MPANDLFVMRVCFWGVRGSTPTPHRDHMAFGGNTSCVEVATRGGALLILDAGTGLRRLGDKLLDRSQRDGTPVKATILLSHLHWDHIQGFPFFRPIYEPSTSLTICASAQTATLFEAAFRRQLSDPYFPVPFDRLPAQIEFRTLSEQPSPFNDARVSCCQLNHPQGATGYRIECGGKVLSYASDHEHGNGEADQRLIQFASGSDAFVCDGQYTPDEYSRAYRGWGHSSWPEIVKLARAAQVRRLVLTHHDPWHDDAKLLEIERTAQKQLPGCILAREGWEFSL